jgi:hypothetical protein
MLPSHPCLDQYHFLLPVCGPVQEGGEQLCIRQRWIAQTPLVLPSILRPLPRFLFVVQKWEERNNQRVG